MGAECCAKVAAVAASYDRASSGSNPLTLKPTPPSSSPSSTAVPASSTSSMPVLNISVPVSLATFPFASRPLLLPSFAQNVVACLLIELLLPAAIFKSLLYEACGRIVDPTYGSVGLLSSGNWTKCQSAVDAVLSGSPIAGTEVGAPNSTLPINACDIRHVARDSSNLNEVRKRGKFKRSGSDASDSGRVRVGLNEPSALTSRDSLDEAKFSIGRRAKLVSAPKLDGSRVDSAEVGLELTLGLG